jgi:hypothetical protein
MKPCAISGNRMRSSIHYGTLHHKRLPLTSFARLKPRTVVRPRIERRGLQDKCVGLVHKVMTLLRAPCWGR